MSLSKHIILAVGAMVILMIAPQRSRAQVTINFNAAVYGQTLEGLSYAQLFNGSTEDVRALITVRVNELSGGNVVTAKFMNVPLRKGMNFIEKTAFSAGRFSFSNTTYGRTLSQSGRFPEGEYEYCFEVEVTDAKTPWINPYFESCAIQQLFPMTPMLLINPPDMDQDCNRRPTFLWQLPSPLTTDARCRFILVEVREKQDIAEAINYNTPLIHQGNIIGNQLLFPSNAPDLVEGKKYAWQVIVYSSKTILKRSEIWNYQVVCDQPVEDAGTESFRELKETNGGDLYIANRFLRFSFLNPYNAGQLLYSISSATEPSKSLKKLPELKMNTGLNKVSIDLSSIREFKPNEEYILKTTLANGKELRLHFIYTTN